MSGAQQERIAELESQLEHAKAALAGSNEGIRLWMLDCAALVEKHRKRADEVTAAAQERISSEGVSLIAAERHRQVEQEGWTPEHDAEHRDGELARAAACYALPPHYREPTALGPPSSWPWAVQWWKPSGDRIHELVKAGALIAAEIDRIDAMDSDDRHS